MNKEKVLPIILLVVSVIFTVVSFLILPDTVVTQISFSTNGGDGFSTMPKLFAVAIPCLLSIGGAAVGLFIKDNSNKKYYIMSAAGIVLFIVMLIVNLAVK